MRTMPMITDTHNDLILLVDHHDRRGRTDHFETFWLPQLQVGGVGVQILPVWVADDTQPDPALRRTLLLLERIHTLAEDHADRVALCLTAEDITRARSSGRIALIAALEGTPAIGQDIGIIGVMHRLGVRVVSLTHLGRTSLADGSGLDDTSNSRLTRLGLDAVTELERLRMVVDVSHLGAAGVEHLLEVVTRPVLASHSGVHAICPTHRNLTDEAIRGIADTGGVVCVPAAIPFFIDSENPSVTRVVDHISHIADLVGIDHVGIGPDFMRDYYETTEEVFPDPQGIPTSGTGDIKRPEDLPKITEELRRRGFGEDDVAAVMGGNSLRVLEQVMG